MTLKDDHEALRKIHVEEKPAKKLLSFKPKYSTPCVWIRIGPGWSPSTCSSAFSRKNSSNCLDLTYKFDLNGSKSFWKDSSERNDFSEIQEKWNMFLRGSRFYVHANLKLCKKIDWQIENLESLQLLNFNYWTRLLNECAGISAKKLFNDTHVRKEALTCIILNTEMHILKDG